MIGMATREQFEHLYAALGAAQTAVDEHFQTVRRMTWYGEAPAELKGHRLLDREWLDEHKALTVKRDEAEERLSRFLRGKEN